MLHLENITSEVLDTWHKILYAVGGASNKRCFIGGGAIRDLILGKPVKDIDVFYEEKLNIKKLHKSLGGEVPTERDTTNYDGESIVIHDWTGDLGALNFVQVRDITSRKHNFAASISTVFYSLPLGLEITSTFLETVHTKKINFYATATEYYYGKISTKYPESEGWTYDGRIVDEIRMAGQIEGCSSF